MSVSSTGTVSSVLGFRAVNHMHPKKKFAMSMFKRATNEFSRDPDPKQMRLALRGLGLRGPHKKDLQLKKHLNEVIADQEHVLRTDSRVPTYSEFLDLHYVKAGAVDFMRDYMASENSCDESGEEDEPVAAKKGSKKAPKKSSVSKATKGMKGLAIKAKAKPAPIPEADEDETEDDEDTSEAEAEFDEDDGEDGDDESEESEEEDQATRKKREKREKRERIAAKKEKEAKAERIAAKEERKRAKNTSKKVASASAMDTDDEDL
jgi:hypothetical protein